jgi:hypothetical protein
VDGRTHLLIIWIVDSREQQEDSHCHQDNSQNKKTIRSPFFVGRRGNRR